MRIIPLALFVPALVGGCTPDALGPSLRLVVANQVDSNLTCSGVMNDGSLPMLDAGSVRITAVVRNSKMLNPMDGNRGTVTAMCDISLPANSDLNKTAVAYPLGAGDKVDFFAEAWDTNSMLRLASGALLNQSTDVNATLPDLRLFATESFRCTAPPLNAQRSLYRLAQSRAFHTATTLPNGQILIAGGLTAAPTGAGDGPTDDQFYLTGTIEVFDPATGTFLAFNEATTPTSRAFHQAALLADPGTGVYQVVLVGGVSAPAMATAATLHDSTGEPSGFRMTPIGKLASAGTDLITYDSNAKTITRTALSNFHPTAFQAGTQLPGGGIVTAGGVTYDMATGTIATLDQHIDASSDGMAVRSAMLPDTRFAGSLAIYNTTAGTSTGIIVGGISNTNAMMPTSPVAKVTLPAGNPVATAYVVKSSFAFPNLEFATLTVIPSATPQILVSGGLQALGKVSINPLVDASGDLYLLSTAETMTACTVNNMPAMCPAYPATQVLAGTGYSFDLTCNKANPHYKPVAWNAATLLPSGDRVLLTGGTAHTEVSGCEDCDNDADYSCALAQSSIYLIATNSIVPITPKGGMANPEVLQIPRYGHTQSILPDGKIAIIGGFTRKLTGASQQTYGVGEVELWNPARMLPVSDSAGDIDDPARPELVTLHVSRAPGKVGTPTSGAFPYTNCCIPGSDDHPCPN